LSLTVIVEVIVQWKPAPDALTQALCYSRTPSLESARKQLYISMLVGRLKRFVYGNALKINILDDVKGGTVNCAIVDGAAGAQKSGVGLTET